MLIELEALKGAGFTPSIGEYLNLMLAYSVQGEWMMLHTHTTKRPDKNPIITALMCVLYVCTCVLSLVPRPLFL